MSELRHFIEEKYLPRMAERLGKNIKEFEGSNILLCGGSGMLGGVLKVFFCWLNDNVFKTRCKIYSVDNYLVNTCRKDFEHPDLINIKHDLCLPIGLKNELNGVDLDFIFNLAGVGSPKIYSKNRLATIDVSTIGTRSLLELCVYIKPRAYLAMSSSEIYGVRPTLIPTPESYIPNISAFGKRGCYDVTKLTIEAMCEVFNGDYGVNTRIIRPFNVISSRMGLNDGRVISSFFYNFLQDKKIQIYKPGTQTRTFCHVADFLVGLILVVLRGDSYPYNLGNNINEISMFDLAKLTEKICKEENLVELVNAPEEYKNEPERRCPDLSRAKGLGYSCEISLEETLQEFYDYAMYGDEFYG